jgi:hypothetical protein
MVIRRTLGESFFAAGAATPVRERRKMKAPQVMMRGAAMSIPVFYHPLQPGERPTRFFSLIREPKYQRGDQSLNSGLRV